MQFTTENEETEEGNLSSLEGIPSGPLGLTLRKSSSFINLIESKLAEEQRKKMEDFVAQPMSEKLRASVLPASQLIIGSWQRISMNEDLIARIYFTGRRLIWEVLEGALKSKIEVQWSDISAIGDHTTDNGFGVLEIELNQPPSFFREINPQPRKRADFTRGQASICRKHTVYFPPGTLDKHYEKLLQSDRRLFDLSRKPFPNHELNPYFNPNPNPNPFEFSDLPADITGNLPEFSNIQHNYHVQKFPPPPILPPPPPNNSTQKTGPYFSFMDPDSPMSVMYPLFVDEGVRSYAYEKQWGNNQGVNINIQRLNSMPMATAQGNDNQNYSLNYGEEFSRIISQNNVENHQLGDAQATCLNEMSFPHSIYPQQYAPRHQVSNEGININSAMNDFTSQYVPAHQVSIEGMNVNSPMNTSMPPQQASNEGMDVNSAMNVFTSQFAPPHQVSIEDMNVNSPMNTSMYQFEPPQQDSNEGVNVDSLMNWGNEGVNNQFQGLNSIDMATAQGNANQNYCLNFGEGFFRMNNPSNTENHLLGDTQATCFDDLSFPGSIYPQQFVPPHQVPNEGMNVNSPMNRFVSHNAPPHQVPNEGMNVNSPMNRFVSHNAPPHLVSNESMNVNSPMNTSMYQYGQPQQVSKEVMNVNSSVNTFIHQYVPPQQVSNEGMNVNSSMNTSTCPYALTEEVLKP